MSQRRMFSPKVTSTDSFLDMPVSARELYFQLGMNADDDGFITPKKIMRMTGASEDDLKMLMVKNFVIPFSSGVIVITAWRVNNYVRKDWYQPTIYKDEMAQLSEKTSGEYELVDETVTDSSTVRPHRLGKVRLGQVRLGDLDQIHQKEGQKEFELFWSLYPVKKAKSVAQKSWSKIHKLLYPVILEDVKKRKESDRQWLEGFVPHPATYLNQCRWEDDITPPRSSTNKLPADTPYTKGKYSNIKSIEIKN